MIDFSQLVTKESKEAAVVASVKGTIAARRYTAETSGTTLNSIFIDTGRDSQALVTGAALSAMLDSTYVCNWKTTEGFIQLDSPTLIGIAQAIRKYVQACFDREAELLAAVDAGTYTDAMLDDGWPT
jgi:hypothetical protein